MKLARAASAAVAEEFAEVDGGWMSPTAATCMTPPPPGGNAVVVARGAVVVTAGAVVVARGTVVVGSDDDVVEPTVGSGSVSITSAGGVVVSRLANRPAASWL